MFRGYWLYISEERILHFMSTDMKHLQIIFFFNYRGCAYITYKRFDCMKLLEFYRFLNSLYVF